MRAPAPRPGYSAVDAGSPLRFAERLKRALVIHRRKTVTEVARELEISRPCFSRVINGHADLSIDLALRIGELLHIDARQLLVDQIDEKLADHEMLP